MEFTFRVLNAYCILGDENLSLNMIKTTVCLCVEVIAKEHHLKTLWFELGVAVL